MMFLSCILDGQGQLQTSSLCMEGSVKVGYIKFYSTQLRSNLSTKQEMTCQNDSLVIQVDFGDCPKLLLALFCTQLDMYDRLTSMT